MGQVFIWLFDFIFQVLSKLSSAIFEPIFKWATENNWISENYLEIASDFLNDYFYKYIIFAKETFINITGFPAELFLVISILLAACFTLFVSCFGLKAALNAYALIRGGKTMGENIKKL